MSETSIVLASVHIDGLPLRFQHGVLVTSQHEWHVALFETRPLQMARELCSVMVETAGGEHLRGMARAERGNPDGRFLMLAGWGSLDEAGIVTDAA
jgi:hypothetical protein